jgi:hypothetical protein
MKTFTSSKNPLASATGKINFSLIFTLKKRDKHGTKKDNNNVYPVYKNTIQIKCPNCPLVLN